MLTKYRYIIGIDPGTNTGYAEWDRKEKKFIRIECLKIHIAMNYVRVLPSYGNDFFVRVEDARKRKWFGNAGKEQLQGAGSIKRDSSIWEDLITDLGIPFEMVAPKNSITKMDSALFKKVTGWTKQTNQHSRDAAMLCFGF